MKTGLLNAASLFHRGSSTCQSPCVCAESTPNSAFDVFSAWMVVIQTINFANPADPIRSVTEINCLGPQYTRPYRHLTAFAAPVIAALARCEFDP